MNSARVRILHWVATGRLSADQTEAALAVAGIIPDRTDWRNFFDRLLGWLGGLALAFSALFMVAWNWAEFGKLAKFGLTETALLLAVAAWWIYRLHPVLSKVALGSAMLLTGVLLALVGQTYQTGADPWQLFAIWSVLILPWVVIGRLPAFWLFWIGLINLAVVLWFQVFGSLLDVMFRFDTGMYWVIFALNTVALVIWEALAGRTAWLNQRWAVRLVGLTAGTAITFAVTTSLFDSADLNVIALLVWVVWSVGIYVIYRHFRADLFMIAGGCLSGVVVITALLTTHILTRLEEGGILLLAVLVIAMGAGIAGWLRYLHREMGQ